MLCVLGFKDALGGGLLCLGLFYIVCGVVFNLQCVCRWGCGVLLMVFDCWACVVVGVLVVLLIVFSGVECRLLSCRMYVMYCDCLSIVCVLCLFVVFYVFIAVGFVCELCCAYGDVIDFICFLFR